MSSPTGRIRLVLADDESLTRGAVGALLGLEADLVVVGEAATGDEAVAAVAEGLAPTAPAAPAAAGTREPPTEPELYRI